VEQKLAALRDAFGPEGCVRTACERHEVRSGSIYTLRRQAMSGELTGVRKPIEPAFAEVQISEQQRRDRDRAAIGYQSECGRHGRCRCAVAGDRRSGAMIPLPPSTRIFLACGATDSHSLVPQHASMEEGR